MPCRTFLTPQSNFSIYWLHPWLLHFRSSPSDSARTPQVCVLTTNRLRAIESTEGLVGVCQNKDKGDGCSISGNPRWFVKKSWAIFEWLPLPTNEYLRARRILVIPASLSPFPPLSLHYSDKSYYRSVCPVQALVFGCRKISLTCRWGFCNWPTTRFDRTQPDRASIG